MLKVNQLKSRVNVEGQPISSTSRCFLKKGLVEFVEQNIPQKRIVVHQNRRVGKAGKQDVNRHIVQKKNWKFHLWPTRKYHSNNKTFSLSFFLSLFILFYLARAICLKRVVWYTSSPPWLPGYEIFAFESPVYFMLKT